MLSSVRTWQERRVTNLDRVLESAKVRGLLLLKLVLQLIDPVVDLGDLDAALPTALLCRS